MNLSGRPCQAVRFGRPADRAAGAFIKRAY